MMRAGLTPLTLAMDLPLVPPNFAWHSPWALALLLIPAAAALWMLARSPQSVLPLPRTTEAYGVPTSPKVLLRWLPSALWLLGLSALIIALARPQLGFARSKSTTDAIAIQIVIDRSGSMGAEMQIDGTQLSRLDVVKRVLRDFLLGNSGTLPGRPNDLVGLCSFARFADTNCPLVRDMNAVVMLADALEPARDQFEGGTAIGDGLALAAARLRTAEQDLKSRTRGDNTGDLAIKSKVIVLLTDGDNNAGVTLPEEAAELCKQWGIKIYVIGIGGGGYTLQRTPFGNQRVPVQSEFDERKIRPIAEVTGGICRMATDAETLRQIYAEIDRLERSSVRVTEFHDFTELFTYPASTGAGCLALSLLLSSTWLRRTPA